MFCSHRIEQILGSNSFLCRVTFSLSDVPGLRVTLDIVVLLPSFLSFVTAPRSQTTPKSYEWPSLPSRKVGKNCKATSQTLMIGCVNIISVDFSCVESCCRPHNGALVAKFMRLSGVILVEEAFPPPPRAMRWKLILAEGK